MSRGLEERWLTSADSDAGAWKCVLLVRSLRLSVTTRSIGVFISDNLSDHAWDMLQDEFDVCFRIGKHQRDKFSPGTPFTTIAKHRAYQMRLTKFVFLDCNCMALENYDELFRMPGVSMGDKRIELSEKWPVFIGTTLTTQEQNSPTEELDHVRNINLTSEVHLDGKEVKLVSFLPFHPLDEASEKCNKNGQRLGPLEKHLLEVAMKLCPEKKKNGIATPCPSLKFDQFQDIKDSTALVGMACRLPGANDVDEFWSLLEKGGVGVCQVPQDRWRDEKSDALSHVYKTEAGFLRCPVDKFDAKFFNTNSADMAMMDPQQRLVLQLVWEGLEHAGINPHSLKNSLTGVFGGWWRNDYKEILQGIGLSEQDFFRAYMGNALGTLTARVSHFFELTGPSISTESGCSTSIVGVDMACDSLRNDKCDVAIVVGANLLLHPFSVELMNGVIAPDGRCKTFDADADGFGRAEGIGVLILKRFSSAVHGRDRIWGVVRGSAVVQEGPSKSMGTPTVQCESLAMTLALQRAGVQPEDVDFVEMHGTGTPVGDPLEVAAVANAYGKRQRKKKLVIGSVKTNIGHTESVSGIAGILKTVLAMKNCLIPPHLHFKKLNPEINLDSIPALIPLTGVAWERCPTRKRIAGVSSFGITGTDAHVIIQEPPCLDYLQELTPPIADQRRLKLLTFSGKTEAGLLEQMRLHAEFLKSSQFSMEEIEYTLNVVRAHLPYRKTIIASTNSEAVEKIEAELQEPKPLKEGVKGDGAPEGICFLFPGQGSQYSGMARSLYEENALFKSVFDYCESLLMSRYGVSLKSVLWDEKEAAKLSQVLNSQFSILCVEYCLLKLWESWGVKPSAVLGHSLGEYGAAVAAGVLDFEDALHLIATRAKLLETLIPSFSSRMLVVKSDLNTTQTMLQKTKEVDPTFSLEVSCINTSEQTVLAGTTENVTRFADICTNNGVKNVPVKSSHAFHCSLLQPMVEEYRRVTSTILHKPPKCKFYSAMDGEVVEALDGEYWIRQTLQTVQYARACHTVLKDGYEVFLELGSPTGSFMMMHNADSFEDLDTQPTCLPCVRQFYPEWPLVLNAVGVLYARGFPINWDNFHRYTFPKERVPLPGVSFIEGGKSYWVKGKGGVDRPFHPLVGTPISSPSETKLFKNSLSLSKLPFLKDHVLGDRYIFPGAGFLEISMASGHAATSSTTQMTPNGALQLRNFLIESPLCLNDKGPTDLQTVVNADPESGDQQVRVFSKLFLDEECTTYKWVRHSTSTFSATLSNALASPFARSLEELRAECSNEHINDYNVLKEYGYQFGDTFKTIKRAFSSNSKNFFYEFEARSDDLDAFILHPCIIDAMFQAQLVTKNLIDVRDEKAPKLMWVPFQVEEFTWYAPLSSSAGFIYVKTGRDEASREVYLFSQDGLLVCSMLGTEIIETTLSSILSLIEAQRTPYPPLYETVWRDKLGPEERRVVRDEGYYKQAFLEELVASEGCDQVNTFSPPEQFFYDESHQLMGLFMQKALGILGLGSQVNVGQEFSWPEIGTLLQVTPSCSKLLRYILLELAKDGWLTKKDSSSDRFVLSKPLPSTPHLNSQIDQTEKRILEGGVGIVELNSCILPVANTLTDILIGKVSPLPILFPVGLKASGPAELYYIASLFARKVEGAVDHLLPKLFSHLSSLPSNTPGRKPILRILEVGAGGGSVTKLFVNALTKHQSTIGAEYTGTDISGVFEERWMENFGSNEVARDFKILNIEEDPCKQGFAPGSYDIVMSAFVIHATRDIRESVRHMKTLLKPGGHLVVLDSVASYRVVDLTFGVLEAFWRFSDHDLRRNGPALSTPGWKKVLRDEGFEDVVALECYDSNAGLIAARLNPEVKPGLELSNSWLIFSNEKDDAVTRRVKEYLRGAGADGNVVTFVDDAKTKSHEETEALIDQILDDQLSKPHFQGIIYLLGLDDTDPLRSIIEPFLCICKYVSKKEIQGFQILTLTKGCLSVGGSDYSNTSSHPSPSILHTMSRILSNETAASVITKSVDLDPHNSSQSGVDEGLSELFTRRDGSVLVAYRDGRRLIPHMINHKPHQNSLELPKSSCPIKLLLPKSCVISDLKFVSMPEPPSALNQEEIEVQVKAYGLNFRDVLAVLKPDLALFESTSVGIDYAGLVTRVGPNVSSVKVGDRVIGARLTGESMPSCILAHEKSVLPLPCRMSYCDGATLPAALATTVLCLINVAQLKEGETVLIHTASGGVGLAAIQIALWKKCRIVATAGNERKRAFLRQIMGVEHVFNSRTTDYQEEVRKALGGTGVDVVLNSITGPGFKEASLALCNTNARFIEMSKMNIWTEEDVRGLRPDVFYKVVDLSGMNEVELQDQLRQVRDLIEGDDDGGILLGPLPYTRFDCSDIRDALEHMEKVRHIGKIVVSLPESQETKNNKESLFPMFNERSTYMITGGLGGIGLEVAEWMASKGARHLLLVGRSQPSPQVQERIRQIQDKFRASVVVRAADIGKYEECEKMVTEFSTASSHFPPLRGVMHAAGQLSDGLYPSQTWDKYETVFNAKVKGSWNLHSLTKGLLYPLEHFVVFSSFTSPMGSPGQSNHASGNQFMDALIQYRNSLGLPGTTVQWGQWGQVGVAANITIPTVKPFTVHQGLAVLEYVMKRHVPALAPLEADISAMRKLLPSTRELFAEVEVGDGGDSLSHALDGEEFWQAYDSSPTNEERHAVLTKFIKALIRATLKLDRNEDIHDHALFQDMGIDSLMMVEIKNGLQASVGKRVKISVSAIKECKTVSQFASKLVELISGDAPIPEPSQHELATLIGRDSIIPDSVKVVDEDLRKTLCDIKELSVILFTGVTGTLGPYLLKELLHQCPSLRKVICLMRESKNQTPPKDRLVKILTEKQLLDDVDLTKVDFVVGEVSQDNLGMSAEVYKELSGVVEGVVHLAAKVSLDEYYADTEHHGHSRQINVGGIKNVLKFLGEKRLKHLFHASTMIAEMGVGEDGRFLEDWPTAGTFDEKPINSAYPVSKYIQDRLIASAVMERGYPCKVFRFPNVGGDSTHGGNFQILDNHLVVRMLAYMYFGIMPAYNFPVCILPVDLCAYYSVRIFLDDKTGFEMYNVCNPYVGDEREFEEISVDMGYPVDVIEPTDYRSRVQNLQSEGRDNDIVQIIKLATNRKSMWDYMTENVPEPFMHWLRGDKDVFKSKKLEAFFTEEEYPKRIKPSWDILIADLQFAEKEGIFDKFGIKKRKVD